MGRITMFLGSLSVLALVAIFAGSANHPVQAASTFAVTKTSDSNDGACDSDCSLREAVIAANADQDASTIQIGTGTYQLSIPGTGEDASATGDLDVASPITIQGAGPNQTIIDGGGLDTVIQVMSPDGDLTLNDLTIQNGHGNANSSGGIYAIGSLTMSTVVVRNNTVTSQFLGSAAGVRADWHVSIDNSQITRNTASGSAVGGLYLNVAATGTISNTFIDRNVADDDGSVGGLASFGQVTLDHVTVEDNSATGRSGVGGVYANSSAMTVRNSRILSNAGSTEFFGTGGIYNASHLTVQDSVIDGNSAGTGGAGGILSAAHSGPQITIERTAITNNTATDTAAGGMWVEFGPATLTNVTISGNSATTDGIGGLWNEGATMASFVTIAANTGATGGLANDTDTFHIANSIVADNSGGPNCQMELFNTSASDGHNIDDGHSCGFTSTGDRQDTDPKLGQLQDNGGDTLTHALLTGSPARDAAASCPPPDTDQRGITRPQGGACDIGAFEVAVVAPLQVEWGAVNCGSAVTSDAALLILGYAAGVSETAPAAPTCPAVGTSVLVDGDPLDWGNNNCSDEIDGTDALYDLLFVAGLTQTPVASCPDIGDTVSVALP